MPAFKVTRVTRPGWDSAAGGGASAATRKAVWAALATLLVGVLAALLTGYFTLRSSNKTARAAVDAASPIPPVASQPTTVVMERSLSEGTVIADPDAARLLL